MKGIRSEIATGEAGGAGGATTTRKQLQELTFGGLNVLRATVKGVNSACHIDCLLRIFAKRFATSSDYRRPKRNGTSEIVAAEYWVYSSGD